MARDIRRWRGRKNRVSLGAEKLTTSRHALATRELAAIASVVSIGMMASEPNRRSGENAITKTNRPAVGAAGR
ncbi:MAG: hypothetical protein ABSE22_00945 [Xanthobacteraceae bacterium]|jgi:hypothetical protein